MTIASEIADKFGNDGLCWTTDDGVDLVEFCNAQPCQKTKSPDHEHTAYIFTDDSCLVTSGGGWDLRAKGCTRWCWDGNGCQCSTKYLVAYQLGGRGAPHDTLEAAVKDLRESIAIATEDGDCQAIRLKAIEYPSDGSDPYGIERNLTEAEVEAIAREINAQ